MENTTAKLRAILLAFFFTIVAFSSFVSATDSDGDGLDDVNDDCPFAAGTSTIDRQGCPDRDGDGEPDVVAKDVLDAIENEKFLVLPHKEVGEYVQRKGNDRDRWISGMQRLQKQFEEFYQSLADQNKGENNEN